MSPGTHAQPSHVADTASTPRRGGALANRSGLEAVGLVALSLVLALAVRAPFFLQADFPLNDGALFTVMSSDLLAHGFHLPAFTSYNGGDIPFCYPPLGIYLAALLAHIGVPLLWSTRFLPLLANLLTVAAFCGLARRLLGRGPTMWVAALCFPLLPFSYQWVLMGGGLTRSFGFLFGVLTAWAAHKALVDRSRRALLATAVVLAGAILSHPEAAVFAVMTVGAVWLAFDRSLRGFGRLALADASAAVISSAWWVTCLVRHGTGPFLAAMATSEWSWRSVEAVAIFFVTAEPFLSVLGVLAVIGFFADGAKGWPFLPIWAVLTLLTVPRSAHTPITLPVALAVGLGLAGVVLPGLRLLVDGARGLPQTGSAPPSRRARTVARAAAGWVIAYALMANWLIFAMGRHDLVALSSDERRALSWIQTSTPKSATFLVLTASQDWSTDATTEWFPALTSRFSPLTAQGSEWLSGDVFRKRQQLYQASKACSNAGVACLDRWAAQGGIEYSHVYISKMGRGPYSAASLYRELLSSKRFQLVFSNAGAAVFQRQW